jgi:hypothetical protein
LAVVLKGIITYEGSRQNTNRIFVATTKTYLSKTHREQYIFGVEWVEWQSLTHPHKDALI